MRRLAATSVVLLALLSTGAAPAAKPGLGSVTIVNPTEVRLLEANVQAPTLMIVGRNGNTITLFAYRLSYVTNTGFAGFGFVKSCEHKAELAMLHPQLAVRVRVEGKKGGHHIQGQVGQDTIQCTLVAR